MSALSTYKYNYPMILKIKKHQNGTIWNDSHYGVKPSLVKSDYKEVNENHQNKIHVNSTSMQLL